MRAAKKELYEDNRGSRGTVPIGGVKWWSSDYGDAAAR